MKAPHRVRFSLQVSRRRRDLLDSDTTHGRNQTSDECSNPSFIIRNDGETCCVHETKSETRSTGGSGEGACTEDDCIAS